MADVGGIDNSETRAGWTAAAERRAKLKLPDASKLEYPAEVLSEPSVLIGLRAMGVDGPDGIFGREGDRSLLGVNTDKPEGRQRLAIAHMYAHHVFGGINGILIERDVLEEDGPGEARARAFAAAFLMPLAGLEGYVAGRTQSGDLRPDEVGILSQIFEVDYEAVLLHLMALGLVDSNKLAKLPPREQAAWLLPTTTEKPGLGETQLSTSYRDRARAAFARGFVTMSQAAWLVREDETVVESAVRAPAAPFAPAPSSSPVEPVAEAPVVAVSPPVPEPAIAAPKAAEGAPTSVEKSAATTEPTAPPAAGVEPTAATAESTPADNAIADPTDAAATPAAGVDAEFSPADVPDPELSAQPVEHAPAVVPLQPRLIDTVLDAEEPAPPAPEPKPAAPATAPSIAETVVDATTASTESGAAAAEPATAPALPPEPSPPFAAAAEAPAPLAASVVPIEPTAPPPAAPIAPPPLEAAVVPPVGAAAAITQPTDAPAPAVDDLTARLRAAVDAAPSPSPAVTSAEPTPPAADDFTARLQAALESVPPAPLADDDLAGRLRTALEDAPPEERPRVRVPLPPQEQEPAAPVPEAIPAEAWERDLPLDDSRRTRGAMAVPIESEPGLSPRWRELALGALLGVLLLVLIGIGSTCLLTPIPTAGG